MALIVARQPQSAEGLLSRALRKNQMAASFARSIDEWRS
jgi:hypothetical protein